MISRKLQDLKSKLEELIKSHQLSLSPEIVLVSKSVSTDRMREAYELGWRNFGESKVQELLRKQEILPQDIRWHFIGHLQTNKVKALLRNKVWLIHSIDSLRLAEALNTQASKLDHPQPCLLQVNISAETSKHGFSPEELLSSAKTLGELDHLKIIGLMGMASPNSEESLVLAQFRHLTHLLYETRHYFNARDYRELSMGMSSDWPLAVKAGATILRIGTSVFGEREVR